MGAPSLQHWLVRLGGAGLLGAMVIAIGAGWLSWREQTHRLDENLVTTSRALALGAERELDQAVAVGRGLAISGYLAHGDLKSFAEQVEQALSPYGYGIIVLDPASGERVLDTESPPQTPVAAEEMNWLRPAAAPAGTAVKPAHWFGPAKGWEAAVEVPARRYLLDIIIPAANFQHALDRQSLPRKWSSVILDSAWTIVARRPTRFIGDKGAAPQYQQSSTPDSVYQVRVLDGHWALAARSRSERYGWTAAVSVPKAVVQRDFLGPALLAAAGGFLVAAAAVGLILVFLARLGRSIHRLAEATEAMGQTQAAPPLQMPVRELQSVADTLQRAGERLALAREHLETRIAETVCALRNEEEERRNAEAALAHAQRLESVGRLTGGIAHDFNNLLTVVSGNLELAGRHAASDEVRHLLARAQAGAARGTRLVSALLSFARKQPLHPELADPSAVVRAFEPVLRGGLGDTVRLRLRLSEVPVRCRIDVAQFEAAVLNLVTNALAAMPRGGEVSIETAPVEVVAEQAASLSIDAGRYLRLRVTDTGTGMSPEVAARAFEPFFTTKEIGKGTGIGLSQVYGFARQSGGGAALSSTPDTGTAVCIYLPVSAPQAGTAAPAEPARPADECGGGQRVLVVDDDPDVRAVLVEGLAGLGYRADGATDGPEALRRLNAGERFDVVVTDDQMPNGITGRELARRVAAMDRQIGLVLLSGHGSEPADAEAAPAFPVLRKPVSLRELAAAVGRAAPRAETGPGAPD